MRKVKALALSFGLAVMSFGGLLLSIGVAQPVAAAGPITKVEQCSVRFLTFPTWFRGLVEVDNGKCVIMSPDAAGGLSPFIWHIVLNVIEIGLQVVGYLAAGFMLWGGFQFLRSVGDPQVAAQGRQTIINAAIGLVISLAAIAAINVISGILIVNP